MAVERFQINIPQVTLVDLNERLARARWPDEIEGAGWDYGTNSAYLRELAHYWQHHYDWRKHEAALNVFNHFRAEIGGIGLHFIHEKGKGAKPLPLLLTHGWPDSFWRFSKLIPMLTDPESYGGRVEDAFDVVVPSIPGFGFSDKPTRRGMTNVKVAELFATLMTELGYDRYAAHGGDWGRGITASLGATQAARTVGLHLTDVPYRHLLTRPPEELSEAEQAYLEAGQAWSRTEGAYAAIQGTKPQTLAYGLNDSPIGLASWLLEKFRAWSDCDGNVENSFSKDELLTNITLYWFTETINSANRLYYETQHMAQEAPQARVEVPTGFAIFPKDLVAAPREVAEHLYNVQRWTKMPRGGHFAAFEEPELLVNELQEFFRPLRQAD